jgi:hypothetical protein
MAQRGWPMARSNCPHPVELLACQDEALEPHRQAEVAAHVRECLACRRYLREGSQIGHLLRQHVAPIDDPEARARLRAHLMGVSPPSTTTPSRVGQQWLIAASLALVMVLGFGLFTTGTIEGGSSFTRWMSDDSSSGQRLPETHVDQTPISAPSAVREEGTLPFSLMPTIQPSGQHGERFFRSPSGLVIAVMVGQAGESQIHIDRPGGATEIVSVKGREVYLVTTQTPEGLAVIGFDWVEAGRLVSVLVLEQPVSGLAVDTAQEIADALMEVGIE